MSTSGSAVTGQRTLIVGASSGIGRGLARALIENGATVVAAARRLDRLEELDGATPIACDVTKPGDVEALVEGAVDKMGGLDTLIYATGLSRLHGLDQASYEDWLELFSTNLFGATLLTRAALPHLQADGSHGRAVFLTSDSADQPYPGLVVYGTSKAALRAYAQGLAAEYIELRVTEVVIGATAGTEVADHFDPDLFGEWLPRWYEEGYIRYEMLQVDDVASMIIEVLKADSPPAILRATGPEGNQTIEKAVEMAPPDQSAVGSALRPSS
jgi:NADP-dependent 3-hydroxy acid dehydrogenase YdfG